MRQRIQTLDGLRFLAALGVLWIHVWTHYGNPRYLIAGIDVNDVLSIGRNGVDLFFVISGFCMYYFYASKIEFSYKDFYRFLIKRWLRLSPAFYAAAIVYVLVRRFAYHEDVNVIFSLFHSAFYLTYLFPQYLAAAHFWTLSVEWQFYFIIPFLLIYQNRIGFNKTFIFIFAILLLAAFSCILITKGQYDMLTNTILFRGIEFWAGVLAARLLVINNNFFKKRALWIIAFILITYAGRILISKHVLSLSVNYFNFFKLAGFTLMGTGFAGILYLSVTSTKWLNAILGNKLFKTMGRISFSFYLWHEVVYRAVVDCLAPILNHLNGMLLPVVATCISAVVLYPISQLSYNILEKPFLSLGNLTTK